MMQGRVGHWGACPTFPHYSTSIHPHGLTTHACQMNCVVFTIPIVLYLLSSHCVQSQSTVRYSVGSAIELAAVAVNASLLSSDFIVDITLLPSAGPWSVASSAIVFAGRVSTIKLTVADGGLIEMQCSKKIGTALLFNGSASSVSIQGISFSGCWSTALMILLLPAPAAHGTTNSSTAGVAITDAHFVNNTGHGAGALVIARAVSGADTQSSGISKNSSDGRMAMGDGDAHGSNTTVTVSNCTFSANSAILPASLQADIGPIIDNSAHAVLITTQTLDDWGTSSSSTPLSAASGEIASLSVAIEGSIFSDQGSSQGVMNAPLSFAQESAAAGLLVICGTLSSTGSNNSATDVSPLSSSCSMKLVNSSWEGNMANSASGALLQVPMRMWIVREKEGHEVLMTADGFHPHLFCQTCSAPALPLASWTSVEAPSHPTS